MKRRVALTIFAGFFIFFILRNLNDGRLIIETLMMAKWQFVAICFGLQILHYVLLSKTYQKALDIYGVKWSLKELIPLNLAAIALNAFTILAPIPGSTVFLKKGRNQEVPALNISASIFLAALFDYIALIPLIAGSLLFLTANRGVFQYEILGIVIFILLTLALAFLLVFGIVSPRILNFLFKLAEYIINKLHYIFKKRDFFIKGWSESRALNFIKLSETLLAEKGKQLGLASITLLNHGIGIATLFFLFAAFGHTIVFASLITGYSLMILFWIVTPTPQGVGVVETLIPALFSSMGVPIEVATLAVLGFRFMNLWLPVIVGYFFLNKILGNLEKD